MNAIFRSNTFAFVLIVLVHVAYKVLYLDYWGFWNDEAFSLYYSQQHWGHIKHISEWDINPPLYYYFLWIWQHLFGISEWAIRASSVLFSSLAAGMLFLLCARNFTRAMGWLAVLLFSVSHEMYFYAHEGRPYSLILFFVLCSSWFFFELLRKPGWLPAVALGLFNFALIYTHYVSGFILLVQAGVTLAHFNKQVMKFVAGAFGITLLIALLRFTKKTFARVVQNEQFSFWVKPGLSDLGDMFYGFFNGPDLFCIFVVAAFISLVYAFRSPDRKPAWMENRARLLYLVLAGPGGILLCFVISLFTPLFVRRYLLFTAPFLYLTLAWCLGFAQRNIRFPLYALVGVFMLFAALRIDFKTPRGMDYRGAMPFVKALQDNGMPVLVETPDLGALFSYYYDREIFADYENMEGRLRDKKVYMVARVDDVKRADIAKADKIVLTQTFEEANRDDKELQAYLNAAYPNRLVFKNYRGLTINVLWR
jgi:mannosyltransferase